MPPIQDPRAAVASTSVDPVYAFGMRLVQGLALLLLIAAVACGKNSGGADAAGGAGGTAADGAAGSGGGGASGAGGQSCPGEGMACSASGTCCPPFVCAGSICFPPPAN